MREARAWVNETIGPREVFVFGGLAMTGYGLHGIYPPLAPLVVGVTLFAMGRWWR